VVPPSLAQAPNPRAQSATPHLIVFNIFLQVKNSVAREHILPEALERLTKPLDIPPTDERAGKRKERLMGLLVARAGYAICESDVAILGCAQRPDAN
jgi:hypothetical protein